MGTDIDHENTDEVVCPYCGYEYSDSWEFDESYGTVTCVECNKKFNYTSSHSVDYTTSKIVCKKDKHNYSVNDGKNWNSPCYVKYEEGFEQNTKMLHEEDWEYFEIYTCSKCDDRDYRKISKEEYIKKYPERYANSVTFFERNKLQYPFKEKI